MLAIIQHNLKKLLAYHSIENIGIIGIGIGMGALGMGYENTMLTFMGFAGALLHTLNHSLFKSLLFFSAGNVYQATGTVNIEQSGRTGKENALYGSFLSDRCHCHLRIASSQRLHFRVYYIFRIVSGPFICSVFPNLFVCDRYCLPGPDRRTCDTVFHQSFWNCFPGKPTSYPCLKNLLKGVG